jgi:hypothetical protein
MLPLYTTQVSYPKQYATALGNRLWKWYVTALCNPSKLPKTICNHFSNRLWKRYVTAYGNGMQPLYATLLSYPKQYATALCNRLWKRYITACLVTYRVMQPFMKMALVFPKSLEPLHLFSRKASQYQ